ncbi:hypothetical protein [Isobaculum melis]|uniref:Uncharacterized protein n=1 Tax=Isobaculum melis TaxID=142588 RepID=A0A1H9T636_9LACT|nr:hypothetical protein [Isobaculum melis]SER92682.1 hypothetical protein SAMN04488559_1112 [Isobaculum melis]
MKAAYDALGNKYDKSDLIKPYPLELSLDYGGETLKRTITVFLTDDTTEVDEKNQIVLYGFDFEASLKKVKGLTKEQVLQFAKASVWNKKMKWGEETAYPTATIQVNLNDAWNDSQSNLSGLNHVKQVGDYLVKFTYQNTSNQKPTAHIKNDPVYLHVRQVIIEPVDQLVLPKSGYLSLANIQTAQLPAASITNIQFETQEEAQQTFKEFLFEMNFDHWKYQLDPVIPQYYQNAGFVVTKTDSLHEAKARKTGEIVLDYENQEAYWLTIYLKPITEKVCPYSWDYQQEDYGVLVP